MNISSKTLLLTLCLILSFPGYLPGFRYSEDELIEDRIDIFESKREIIAVIDGGRRTAIDLRSNEEILWQESKGLLGAVLTEKRLLLVSATVGRWRELPLRNSESDSGQTALSEQLALMVTRDRIIGFTASSGNFIETRLPIDHQLIEMGASKNIAVAVTSKKAYGLAARTARFSEISFRIREDVEQINISARKASIRTSDRLLTFGSKSRGWQEYEL